MRSTLILATVLISLATCQVSSASVLNWIWGKQSESSTSVTTEGLPLVSIPYEMMTEDEKFLLEASKLTDIQVSSPLETCQHKVVMKIRTSCSDMSEEDLAKLSVNLLNCQSLVEGRKVFPCTENMSLKQCTTEMDADMWNAYHLMSNRARAVCYASRSTQFRALTELTVNKLMESSHSQIKVLSSLKESQERLEENTIEALSALSKGNSELLRQQEMLQDAQLTAQNLVTSNLRELNNEKAIIRTGHAQLASMAEDIRNKLETANRQILHQATERKENHKEILDDLENIQEQARLLWAKIESSTNRIVLQNAEAAAQYEATLKKLEEINSTITFIWNMTNTMRAEVDEKLKWITEYIGATGENLHKVYRTSQHIVYLLLAMIVSSFLQAPFLTRAMIMGIIPLNLATYLKHGLEASLDFVSITALILLITGMHYVMMSIQYILAPKKKNYTTVFNKEYSPQEKWISNGTASANEVSTSNSVTVTHEPNIIRNEYESVPRKNATVISTLGQKVLRLLSRVSMQITRLKITVCAVCSSMMFWNRRSESNEELSCSYLPARRLQEAILTSTEYPSMSDDMTGDFETSDNDYEKRSDDDSLTDAKSLRRRVLAKSSIPSFIPINADSRSAVSLSRSVSPNTGQRSLCSAVTRTGKPCRLVSALGQSFCHRHLSMEDTA